MRNISFSITTPQIRARTKDVTRRLGWANLKVGDQLCAVEKGMGLKAGERVVRLCIIEVVDVRFERLDRLADDYTPQAAAYGLIETRREGFPDWSAHDFVGMFLRTHKGCELNSVVTRIEFKYVDSPDAHGLSRLQ